MEGGKESMSIDAPRRQNLPFISVLLSCKLYARLLKQGEILRPPG